VTETATASVTKTLVPGWVITQVFSDKFLSHYGVHTLIPIQPCPLLPPQTANFRAKNQ